MRLKIIVGGLAILVLGVMLIAVRSRHISSVDEAPPAQAEEVATESPADTPAPVAQVTEVAPTNVPLPQMVDTTTETNITATQMDGVVTNADGSVNIRGSASFQMMPVSAKPPVFVPESEVRAKMRNLPQK